MGRLLVPATCGAAGVVSVLASVEHRAAQGWCSAWVVEWVSDLLGRAGLDSVWHWKPEAQTGNGNYWKAGRDLTEEICLFLSWNTQLSFIWLLQIYFWAGSIALGKTSKMEYSSVSLSYLSPPSTQVSLPEVLQFFLGVLPNSLCTHVMMLLTIPLLIIHFESSLYRSLYSKYLMCITSWDLHKNSMR